MGAQFLCSSRAVPARAPKELEVVEGDNDTTATTATAVNGAPASSKICAATWQIAARSSVGLA